MEITNLIVARKEYAENMALCTIDAPVIHLLSKSSLLIYYSFLPLFDLQFKMNVCRLTKSTIKKT